jgi:ubiquinone/menaquinone biosynthesis C-methylase UbiE
LTTTDYRSCHASLDAASGYERTYASGYYAAQWEQLEKPLVARLFAELQASGAARMLDMACGQGRITLLGAEYFREVLGIDYSAEMLSVARDRMRRQQELPGTEIRFAAADVRDFTAEPPFDVVTAFRFFLNAEDALRREGVRCARRNLKSGGTFITNVHVAGGSPLAMFYRLSKAARRLRGRPPNPVRNFISLHEFRRFLDGEGFDVTQVYRYSILPRIGRLTDSLAERHLAKIENFARVIPGAMLFSQSFLVCAQRKAGEA